MHKQKCSIQVKSSSASLGHSPTFWGFTTWLSVFQCLAWFWCAVTDIKHKLLASHSSHLYYTKYHYAATNNEWARHITVDQLCKLYAKFILSNVKAAEKCELLWFVTKCGLTMKHTHNLSWIHIHIEY